MDKNQKLTSILREAEGKEKSYDWLKSAQLYEQALDSIGRTDFLKKGQVQERIGHCLHRAAMQAESQDEFKQRIQEAIKSYEKAQGFYQQLKDEEKEAWRSRSEAHSKYLGYWVASDASEKRRLLDKCLDLKGEALAAFLKSGNKLEYGRTYGNLSLIFADRCQLEWNRQVLKNILEKGLEWGERAVAVLSEPSYSYELARTYLTLTTCMAFHSDLFVADPEEKDRNRLKIVKHLNKALDLSKDVGDANLSGLLHFLLGGNTGGDEEAKHFEKTLEFAKLARDKLLIAYSLDLLTYTTYWEAISLENPEKMRELAEKAMGFYDRSQRLYSIMSFMSPRGGFIGPPAGPAEHYLLGSKIETDLKKRQEFLEKSEKAGMKALKLAEDSDKPIPIESTLHVVSKTLEARAQMETDPEEKSKFLEEALKYREKAIDIHEQRAPFDYWNAGVYENYLAGIKAELAKTEYEPDNKRKLLEEAVVNQEKCLRLCSKMILFFEKQGHTEQFSSLHAYQDAYATLLTRLYDLTNSPEHLRKAIEILQKAIESAKKIDKTSYIARKHWKIAKAQDVLREHLAAAESFRRASESYLKAAEKIPQLKVFYQDYTVYMQAWSEIENAKHYHTEKRYELAKNHYQKAADLHKSTERWGYLTLNYLAWARLEEAENLSRRERAQEATNLFEEAAKLFVETKKSIQATLEEIESTEEKRMSINLVKTSAIRREYCLGRIDLEEAKILDRKGDHAASSRKYAAAAEKFRRAMDTVKGESDRQELQPIIYLSQAWHTMTRAEAEASPELYLQASKLFDEAKEASFDERSKGLALGHSRFCMALEAATRFEDVRDASLHKLATQHLESAANYYLRAGFKNASEYAEATQKLLDAYLYMYDAKIENDPSRKTRLYMMAEKVLQASAGSFLKAKHPEKQEQVSRLLQKVRKERELALSLTEILHAPLATSTTTTFQTPECCGDEKPIGLERFEHADIQANLVFRAKETKIGDDLNFKIELVNTGKAPALLVKVDEIVPEGFEIQKVPETYGVEDSYINMKGRRLDPLKTEDVKIIAKPLSKGIFKMKPRILYLDETGKYKTHEPDPVTITVKELGISGWIKGKR